MPINIINEQEIFNLLLGVDTSWKTTLEAQLHNATVTHDNCGSSYFLRFHIDKKCTPIHIACDVPMEIIIDHIPAEHPVVMCKERKSIQMFGCNPHPTGFVLHLSNGYIKELEVYSLSGDYLDPDVVCSGKRYYFIFCK